MTAVVDSRHQELDNDEIIAIAAQDTGSPYSPEQVKASLVAETHEAGAIIMRQGNTLFVVHKNPNQPTEAFFRALNADTARNFIKRNLPKKWTHAGIWLADKDLEKIQHNGWKLEHFSFPRKICSDPSIQLGFDIHEFTSEPDLTYKYA